MFHYDYVKGVLCDACKLKIPDVWENETFNHYCNGILIPCAAIKWRTDKEVLSIAVTPTKDTNVFTLIPCDKYGNRTD